MVDNDPLGWLQSHPFNERFFGNGSPDWSVGPNEKLAPPAAVARSERRRIVKRLRKWAKLKLPGWEYALGVADRLKSCKRDRRCWSGACPLCQRAAQRWWVWTLNRFERRAKAPLAILSIIPETQIAEGVYDSEVIRDLRAKLISVIKKSGLRLIVGGIDFSWNEHEAGLFAPHIVPHFWLIGREAEIANARPNIAEAFRNSETVRAAVRVYAFNGDRRAYAYSLKWQFNRRVALEAKLDNEDRTEVRRNTRNRFLRRDQQVQLAILLDDLGLSERLILYGARSALNMRGKPAIRINSKFRFRINR